MAANSEAPHVFLAVLLLFTISAIYCGKLNAPKVLLPFSRSISTNFTLEVTDGGCFYWSVSRPEIVRLHVLHPDEKGCSSSAVVSAAGSQALQQSTLVTLRQETTREVIQCEVMVSTIHALQILTTSRELVLEDTPEMFTLTAVTKEGDTFSTLEGLVFQWHLITDKDTEDVVDAHDILRFVKFGDSQYKAPPSIKHMESRGVMGYVALVEGIKTGTAKVSAAFVDDSYDGPISTEVTLTVVANMMLWPPYEVHALVGSVWHYDVQHVQYGIVRKITMPSEQFYLSISDTKIAVLDPQTSNVEALSLGHTTAVLHDKNIKNKQTFRQPVAGIRVVQPHRIEFFIEPHNNWFLISGYNYTITVKIFGRDGVEILATENLRVDTTFSDNLQILSSSKNGSWHYVNASRVGVFELTARADRLLGKFGIHKAITPELLATRDGEVLDRIEVTPPVVIVPWDPLNRHQYNIELQAKGGGSYGHVWSSSNATIVDCDRNGVISTKNKGTALIFASSTRNPHIFGTSQVFVSTPDKIAFVDSAVEAEIGSVLRIPIELFTSRESAGGEIAFSDCTKLPFQVESDDVSKLRYINESLLDPELGGCAVIQFRALDVGFAQVTVGLPVYSTILKISKLVAIYKPLTVLNSNDIMLLPLGSMGHIAFEGGPRPWILKPQGYFQHITAQNTSVINVESPVVDRTSANLHYFMASCKSFGETNAIMKVGNVKSEKNVKPVTSIAYFRVICAKPYSLDLVALVHRPSMARTPCMLEPGHAVSQCYNPLSIMLQVKDSKGRVFDNLTSFTFQWQVSDKSLATIMESEKTFLVDEDTSKGFPIIVKNYQTLRTANVEGTVKVTCTLNGYRQDVIAALGIRADFSMDPAVTQSLLVDLVDDGTFTTDKIFMFDHPSSTTSIKITRGSGVFDFEPRDHPAASITFDEKNRVFQMTPNHEGTFVLTAIDRCLKSNVEATLQVRVVGIHSVNVKMVDKVELGKEITASVTVLDDEHRPFVGSIMSLLDIVPQASSGVISISNYSRTNVSGHSVATFTVKAAALGHSTVTFFVSRKGIDREPSVMSVAHPIQVFSPLKINPTNITLVIGAKFQVTCIGGPQPSSIIEYSVADSHVASVSGAGIVEAMHIGHTTIAAYAVSTDSETGVKNVHSRDEVTVYVVSLSGIRIRSPLTRWSVDSIIPVFAIGSNENEKPYAFGSAIPALSFKWSISNKEVVRVLPTYHAASVQQSEENDFAVRLLAKQPGVVALQLHAGVTQPASFPNYQVVDNMVLVDEIQLQVFDNLQLIAPKAVYVYDNLLITPQSSMRLSTNKDQVAAVSYQVVETGKVVAKNKTNPCIKIDKIGNLQTADATCSGIVLIDSRDGAGLMQTMSLLVTVKPVSYLMVTPKPLLHTRGTSPLIAIPLGTHFKLKVTFHDNMGKEFSNTACRIQFRPSRFDLVEVTLDADNNTLSVRTNNPGVTVLRVWDADLPRLEDFVPIVTGEAISPSDATVYLGSRICFRSPLVTSLGNVGKWTGDNEAVLAVSEKGYAITMDVGTATVFYTVSDTVTTSTEVNVLAVTEVSVHPSTFFNVIFTNAHPGKIYHVPLRVSGVESKKESLVLPSELDCATDDDIPHFVPFKCHVRFTNPATEIYIEDVFSTSVAFNVEKGVPECLVTSLPVSDRTARQLCGLNTNIEIDVNVPEHGRQPGITSNKVTVQFAPAFYVRTSELNLTDLDPKSSLILFATKMISASLQVTAKEASMLQILPMIESIPAGSYEPPTVEIPVELSSNFWRTAKVSDQISTEIEITCLITKQTVMVPVRVKVVGDDTGRCAVIESRTGFVGLLKAIADSSQNWIIMILSVFGTAVAIFIGYHALVGQKYADVSHSGVYLNRSGLDETQTGWIGSPRMTSSPRADEQLLWSPLYSQRTK